jgi:hypothetical protein
MLAPIIKVSLDQELGRPMENKFGHAGSKALLPPNGTRKSRLARFFQTFDLFTTTSF